MEKIEQILELGKANSEEIAVEFEKLLIGAARHAVCQVMAMEVENLCGPKYRPAGNGKRREGSAKGQFIFRDVRVDVERPRVRRGKDGGEEELGKLKEFVGSVNVAAYQSLEEPGDELIALHLLDAPSTLNETLLSTKAIENSFKNARRKMNRVDRWNPRTGMASKWLASALLYVESGFHRIKNYADLGKLAEALEWPANPSSGGGLRSRVGRTQDLTMNLQECKRA